MKVVVASTEEQEEILNELVKYFYSTIFPQYFSDKKIKEYVELKILEIPEKKDEHLFTLDVASQAITSLQVIITILDLPISHHENYKELFEKNVALLKQSGLFFPFTYQNFFENKRGESDILFSLFAEPTNELLN